MAKSREEPALLNFPSMGKAFVLCSVLALAGIALAWLSFPPNVPSSSQSESSAAPYSSLSSIPIEGSSSSYPHSLSVGAVAAAASQSQRSSNNTRIVSPPRRVSPLALSGQKQNPATPALPIASGHFAIPVAFASSAADLGLNEEQAATLAAVQSQFVKALGGPNADPTDPVYAKRWLEAQPLADETVWAQLGQDAYEAMVNQAAQNAH